MNVKGVFMYSSHIHSNSTTTIAVDGWPDGLYAFVFNDGINDHTVTKVAIIRR